MQRPQIKIYFETDEEVQMVKDVAKLLGTNCSMMLREMILNSLPTLNKVGLALQEAKKDPTKLDGFIDRFSRDVQRTMFDEIDEIQKK